MVVLFLPQLDFTEVELWDFINIFFPEHFSMTTSNNTLNQSISAQNQILRESFLCLLFSCSN